MVSIFCYVNNILFFEVIVPSFRFVWTRKICITGLELRIKYLYVLTHKDRFIGDDELRGIISLFRYYNITDILLIYRFWRKPQLRLIFHIITWYDSTLFTNIFCIFHDAEERDGETRQHCSDKLLHSKRNY